MNMSASDTFLETSANLLSWDKTASITRQYQSYLDSIVQAAPPHDKKIKNSAHHLLDLEVLAADDLEKSINKTQRYLNGALHRFNHLKIKVPYLEKQAYSPHLLHNSLDDKGSNIALTGLADLLECSHRLWLIEIKSALIKWSNRQLLGIKKFFKPLPSRFMSDLTRENVSNIPTHQALFDKKIRSLSNHWITLKTPEEKVQWLNQKISAFAPTLKALENRLTILTTDKQHCQTKANDFLQKNKINTTLLSDLLQQLLEFDGDENSGFNQGAMKQLLTSLNSQKDKNHCISLLEQYAAAAIKENEVQRLHQAFSAIAKNIEHLKKEIEEKQIALRKQQEKVRSAQRNEALILFQRYLACQQDYQITYGPERQQKKATINLIKNELNKLLGINQLWPWQIAWHWLSFHCLYWLGARYFKHLRQLRKSMRTGGHFSLIAQFMLKRDFISTEYNVHVLYTQQTLYGSVDSTNSLLAYHSQLLNNTSEKNTHDNALPQTEAVIRLLNNSPYFYIDDSDSSKITLSPQSTPVADKQQSQNPSQTPLVITDKQLMAITAELKRKKENQAKKHFQKIRRTFKRSLNNTWSTFFTQSVMEYNGLSLRKLLHFFTKNEAWDINHSVHALISLLRSQGCRLDALRLYFTLEAMEKNDTQTYEEKMQDFLSIVKNIFEQFRVIDYSVDRTAHQHYANYHKFKLLCVNHSLLLDHEAMNERLRDPLMVIVNDIFEHFGHHETVEKQIIEGETHYHFVPTKISNKTMKERLGTRWWIPTADAISLFNALGSAFFAGFAFFLTGQLLWGCIILVAAFFANILLFVTAQRETFIELFVKSELMSGISLPKKIVIGAVLLLCLISCLFEGYLIGVSTATALAHLAFLPSVAALSFSALVGTIMALGMFALFFYMSITLIKNDFHLEIWHFIQNNLLFKGFLDKSLGEQCIYLMAWVLNVILLPLAIVGGIIYTSAYLGLGYDQMVKGLQKIPHLTYAFVATAVGLFVGIAFIMELTFAEKNFVRLANVIISLPETLFNHIKQSKKSQTTVVGFQRSVQLDLEEPVIMDKDSHGNEIQKSLTEHYEDAIKKGEVIPTETIQGAKEFSLPDNSWNANNIGLKDTLWNNPERCFIPFAKLALYVLVLGFLIPINAFGNAKSTAEGAPTLVELLHSAGFHQVSEWIVNNVVFLTCLVGSLGVCGLSSHDELSKGIPTSQPHPQLPDLVKRYQAFTKPKEQAYTYTADCEMAVMTNFFSPTAINNSDLSQASIDPKDHTVPACSFKR
ncbi:MAG: hypothetical protein ACX932_04660 [Gammaproteobacteria bacterium]